MTELEVTALTKGNAHNLMTLQELQKHKYIQVGKVSNLQMLLMKQIADSEIQTKLMMFVLS
jgi:hypothetical protein